MKIIQMLFISLAMLVGGHALALPADHPANPAAAAGEFRPVDYFSGKPLQLAAADPHHHGEAAQQDSEGKGCKREGKGCCCCCTCCDKGDAQAGEGCMRKSAGEHAHGEGKSGCGMMKKDMEDGKAGADHAHEGHH